MGIFLKDRSYVSTINNSQVTYQNNINLITAIYILFFGGIGVVLGLDNFTKELKKDGKWKIDIPKIIILGLPSLLFSIPNLVYNIIPSALQFAYSIGLVSCIVFGYTLITSLFKEDIRE